MDANARWQEVIARNLASGSVPGFKKQAVAFGSTMGGAHNIESAGSTLPTQNFTLPAVTQKTDFASGEMKYTGHTTDFAVEGPGFFEVQMPDGEIAYTRDGEFQVNALGQLVTKEGYLVLSDGGSILIDLNNPASLSVAPNGEVSQGADQKGKLRIVEFDHPDTLTQISGSYFLAQNPEALPLPSETSHVRQGFLESSNAVPLAEMADMMSAMRNFEANQRVVQIQDERMMKAINELGYPT